MTERARRLVALALGTLTATMFAGCTGVLNGADPGGSVGVAGSGSASGGSSTAGTGGVADLGGPGRVVMHRLNVTEYNNTVRDLLGTQLTLPESFPADLTAHSFDNVAVALIMTDAAFAYYSDTAKRLAAEALTPERRSRLFDCDVAVMKEVCVSSMLARFLPQAWRRPTEAGDVEGLVRLFTDNKSAGDSDDQALTRVLQAVLVSAEFLFRIERNTGVAGVRALDGYEIASRLSYFLWSSMPDADLFAAAASGALQTPDGVAAQVTRMLADPRAAAFGENFGGQWLPIRALAEVVPDARAYPEFDEELRAAMRAETHRFFLDVASGAKSFKDLLSTSSGYVNDRLAQHYGLPTSGSTEPVFRELSPGRGGLLTQGTFLTVNAYPDESNPVRRGKWILANLFCQEPPAPPPDVQREPPPQQGVSRKERLASHRTDPICASCHNLMDPLGLALEQYDGIGQFRTVDNGVTIDPSGQLLDGTVITDAVSLQLALAENPRIAACVAQHLFTYALGRAPRIGSGFDDNTIEQLSKTFNDSGQLFPQLMQALTRSDVFSKREDEATTP